MTKFCTPSHNTKPASLNLHKFQYTPKRLRRTDFIYHTSHTFFRLTLSLSLSSLSSPVSYRVSFIAYLALAHGALPGRIRVRVKRHRFSLGTLTRSGTVSRAAYLWPHRLPLLHLREQFNGEPREPSVQVYAQNFAVFRNDR